MANPALLEQGGGNKAPEESWKGGGGLRYPNHDSNGGDKAYPIDAVRDAYKAATSAIAQLDDMEK